MNATLAILTAVLAALLLGSIAPCVKAGYVRSMIPKNLTAKASTWNNNPIFAMDGNTDGTLINGVACIHSNGNDMAQWWMVDMRSVYDILAVRVWNRLDSSSWRFTRITIGVSRDTSVWTSFNLSQFSVCYYYSGPAAVSESPFNFTCNQTVSGRYLTVYKDGNAASTNILHFCEIDIYAYTKSPQPHLFSKIEPSFSDIAFAAFDDLLTDSQFQGFQSITSCAMQCSEHIRCVYALYGRRSCYGFEASVIPSSFRAVYNASDAAFFAFV